MNVVDGNCEEEKRMKKCKAVCIEAFGMESDPGYIPFIKGKSYKFTITPQGGYEDFTAINEHGDSHSMDDEFFLEHFKVNTE